MDSDWEHLPKHLLDRVLDKTEEVADWLTFHKVCPSWRSTTNDNKSRFMELSKHRVPMLLVPNESIKHDDWSVYNVLSNKFLHSNLLLPPFNRPLCGSSEGWLATLDKKFRITLYKPFDQTMMICLPPLFPPTDCPKQRARRRDFYVLKITTFTPDPIENPKDLILVVIFGEFSQLAYIRPSKDAEWTMVTSLEHRTSGDMTFADVAYYNGQFYATSFQLGKLVSFDATKSEPQLKTVAKGFPWDNADEDCRYKTYLVESCQGELLQVQRYIKWDLDDRVTTKFKIFKYNEEKWDEIKSLGECALFLGDNSSISVLASKFPGCHKNRIYFTHDKNTVRCGDCGPWDLGVYDIESEIVTPRFTFDEKCIAKMRRRVPIFVLL